MNALLVGPEAPYKAILRKTLFALGYELNEAENAVSALIMLERHPVSLLITPAHTQDHDFGGLWLATAASVRNGRTIIAGDFDRAKALEAMTNLVTPLAPWLGLPDPVDLRERSIRFLETSIIAHFRDDVTEQEIRTLLWLAR